MIDNFREEVVTKHNRTTQNIAYILANIMMVVTALFAVICLSSVMTGITTGQFSWFMLIMLLVNGGIAVVLFLFRDKLKTEYEYSFTNGDLDFAEVYNNNKRKNLGTMKVKNVESFGPVDSDHFRRLVNTPGIKIRNWFLNRGANLYYFYFQKESVKNVIVFEPSEEMVGLIRKYLPRGVYQE